MVSSDHIDCDCGHFGYTFWAIQLHVRVASVQDPNKFVDQSLGVAVSKMPRTPSLRSLFLAWVCFSVAFSTVFLAFLTTFLIDSGYKTPIKTVDELFTSGIKLAYPTQFSGIIENGDETEVSKVLKNRVDCPSFHDCMKWAMYQKNMSIMFSDITAEYYYATGFFWREIGTLVVQVRRRCIFSSWSHHDNVSWTPTNEAS